MKKIEYLFLSLAILISASCAKDPWKTINEGDWNHEHSIIGIKFEGQAGLPVITNVDAATGTIDLQLATDNVADMSKVKVEYITLSYNAEGTVKSGETIDFTQADPSITVISPNGDARVYAINMKEFSETLVGRYKVQTRRHWGGTGPEYGGAYVSDPSVKSWCWDAAGYGPAAEYDNYLEFTLDRITDDGNTEGTCIQYAGADGKYWNCIFAAKMNKEGKTAIDLHKYYRLIPMGTSKWTRNYTDGTISFTDADGVKTTGELLEAGTYQVYTNKNVEVTDRAFKFNLPGVDDWTNIYSDYDVFVKKVRAHFIMFEKVDEIPAASMTEGSEGDITIAPEPEPESATVAGTYKLSSFMTFGGVEKPIFMKPADKAWIWKNQSVYNEGDNILVLTAAGKDSYGREVGEADYQAGADGKYWEYVMLSKYNKSGTGDLDVSSVYGLLPHGKSAYVYDEKEKTISFASGIISVTVKYLAPGKYEYASGSTVKELNVASTMAIDFVVPGATTTNWDYVYSEFDWLYYSAHNYIMCFDKQ